MRHRPAKSVLNWLLAGVVAALSIAGSGLHTLLGIQHGPERYAVANEDSATCALQSVSAAHAVAAADLTCDEGNCPVCNYLAAGRLSASLLGWSFARYVPRAITSRRRLQFPLPISRYSTPAVLRQSSRFLPGHRAKHPLVVVLRMHFRGVSVFAFRRAVLPLGVGRPWMVFSSVFARRLPPCV